MNAEQRRRTLASSAKNNLVVTIFLSTCVLIILTWIRMALHFLVRDDVNKNINKNINGIKGTVTTNVAWPMVRTTKHDDATLELHDQIMIALELDIEPHKTITIRISVFSLECPKAYEFLTWMIDNQKTECRPCTIYRGEPVPSYWGSPDYPDRWDNGGRWGPPYALVQGGFPNARIQHVEREAHRPPVKRGSVAWAGPRGIHFFVALADHPEWKDEHTVWGRVMEEDIQLLDALVDGSHRLKVLEQNVPVVTNFVEPIPFRIREYS